jgi:hypothetical protein
MRSQLLIRAATSFQLKYLLVGFVSSSGFAGYTTLTRSVSADKPYPRQARPRLRFGLVFQKPTDLRNPRLARVIQ